MAYDWPKRRQDSRPRHTLGTRQGATTLTRRARAQAATSRRQSPVPPRGRAVYPGPNPPVPPRSVGPRHQGEPEATYASVIRRGPPRGHRGSPPTNPHYEPADPAMGKLIRKIHSLLKMTHHLQNVSPLPEQPGPRGIMRTVDNLSTFIKPASPTNKTTDFIRANAQNWGHTTLLILQDHYTEGIDVLLTELESELPDDWEQAFEIAVRWARRNLPHISQDVIDHIEAQLMSYTNKQSHTTQTEYPPLSGPSVTKPSTHARIKHQYFFTVAPTVETQTALETQAETQALIHPLPAPTVTPQPPPAQTPSLPLAVPVQTLSPIQQPQQRRRSDRTNTVSTMTSPAEGRPPDPGEVEPELRPVLFSTPETAPLEPRPRRLTRRRLPNVVPQSLFDTELAVISTDPLTPPANNPMTTPVQDTTPVLIPTAVPTQGQGMTTQTEVEEKPRLNLTGKKIPRLNLTRKKIPRPNLTRNKIPSLNLTRKKILALT